MNGANTHGLDFDDGHTNGSAHPSGVVFPAVLAAAEQYGATPREIILAAVMGYDVMCRIAAAIRYGGTRFDAVDVHDAEREIEQQRGRFRENAGAPCRRHHCEPQLAAEKSRLQLAQLEQSHQVASSCGNFSAGSTTGGRYTARAFA